MDSYKTFEKSGSTIGWALYIHSNKDFNRLAVISYM